MAWTYTAGAQGLLTSTGATEAAPDSLLEGIALAQAADPTKAYRSGNLAWVQNIDIRASGTSFIKADDESAIEFKGSSGLRGAGGNFTGGFIGGSGARFVLSVTVNRFTLFQSGSTFITQRKNPRDPAFSVYQNSTVRVDFPTFGTVGNAQVLAKIDVNGLDLYANVSTVNIITCRFYAGSTISNIKDVRAFDRFGNESMTMLLFNATYADSYFENISFGSEAGLVNTVNLPRPTFYRSTPGPLIGLIRSANFKVTNPTFLSNCWNGLALFGGGIAATSKLSLSYTYINTFRSGLIPVQGVNVRFVRARQSVNGAPTWAAPDAVLTAASNAQGQYAAVNLIDTYREGLSLTDLERFSWTGKARAYSKRTAGETLFEARVLYQHSVNMSAGYGEEVQMLDVPNLTLTQAQAAALTGLAFAPSGATSGTLTLTEPRTAGELWAAFRNWIAQIVNFDSSDTWTFDGVTLNVGAWNITGSVITGNVTTTGAVASDVVGLLIDANNAGSISVTGLGAADFAEMRKASDNTLIAVRTGPGSFAVSPSNQGASVYFRRMVGAELVMSTVTTPVTLAAGANPDVPLFYGAQVQVAQAAQIDALPTLPQIEASAILAKEVSVQARATLTQIEQSKFLALKSDVWAAAR